MTAWQTGSMNFRSHVGKNRNSTVVSVYYRMKCKLTYQIKNPFFQDPLTCQPFRFNTQIFAFSWVQLCTFSNLHLQPFDRTGSENRVLCIDLFST